MSGVERFDKQSFQAGYLIAVANIMHLHDEDMVATDVLHELGADASDPEKLGLTEYDREPLELLFENIANRRRADAERAARTKGGES